MHVEANLWDGVDDVGVGERTTIKMFLVAADNLFLMSTTPKDMICEIQKIEHLWCLLPLTDIKNHIFSVGWLCQPAPKINF
jgi:hypothetical protein